MIIERDARVLIDKLLVEWGIEVDGGLVLLDEKTVTKPYGWIFFYTGRRWLETNDITHGVAGNGPVVVLSNTGEVVVLGTARVPKDEIADFELSRGLTPT